MSRHLPADSVQSHFGSHGTCKITGLCVYTKCRGIVPADSTGCAEFSGMSLCVARHFAGGQQNRSDFPGQVALSFARSGRASGLLRRLSLTARGRLQSFKLIAAGSPVG